MEVDLESDLWNQAEFTRSYVEPPPSLAKRRGRTSIFDDDPEELVGDIASNKQEPRVKMIRGRPVKVKSDERPGGLQAYTKTQKDIREVCGVGYSNELIETFIKCNQRANGTSEKETEKETERVKMPDLSFKKQPFPQRTQDDGNIPAMFSYNQLDKNFNLNDESEFPTLK